MKGTAAHPGTVNIPVDADYSSTGQNRMFKLSGNQATIATAQGERAPLLLLNAPTGAEQGGLFATSGAYPMLLGGTVAALDPLTTGTDGRLEVAAASDEVVGYALEAGVAGDIITGVVAYAGVL